MVRIRPVLSAWMIACVCCGARGQRVYPVDREPGGRGDGFDRTAMRSSHDTRENLCGPMPMGAVLAQPLPVQTYFGADIDLSGEWMIVGDPFDDEPMGLDDVGAVYFFERGASGWEQRGRVVVPQVGIDGSLGRAVAIDDDTAVTSSIYTFGFRGEAYIMRRSAGPAGSEWALETNVKPDPALANVFFFGFDVDVQGPLAAISALYSDANPNGWVELHEKIDGSWRLLTSVRPPDGTIFDDFGRSIALSGSRLLVGAPYHPDPTFEGAAYLFKKDADGWTLEKKLVPPGLQPGDLAGWQVALDGETAIVATPYTRTALPKVWVYRLVGDEWTLSASIVAPRDNSFVQSDFARSIALKGDTLAVGAPFAEIWGGVYVYRRFAEQWSLLGRVRFDDVSTPEVFLGDLGRAVAVEGSTVLASAPSTRVGESRTTITGSVLPIELGDQVFTISRHPVSVMSAVGGRAEFTGEAVGPGTITYQWLKGDQPIVDGGRISGATTTTLTIEALVLEDSALYSLRATSPECGEIVSDWGLLDMGNCIELITAPDAQTLLAGEPLVLTVEAHGLLPLTYRWTRSNVDLVDDGRIMGSTTNTLTVNPTLPEDQAVYQLIISSQCGEVFSNKAVVNFHPCSTIMEQPADLFTFTGDTLRLSVGATSHVPLTYQWWRNGMQLQDGGRLTGANSPMLTISDCLVSDAGRYRCSVSCVFNESSSREAVVTLNPPGCLGDANGDRRVNMVDLSTVLEMWGFNYRPMTGTGDTDRDGLVGFGDLTMVLARYGAVCP